MNIKDMALERVAQLDRGEHEGVDVEVLIDDLERQYSLVRLAFPDGVVLYELLVFDGGEVPDAVMRMLLPLTSVVDEPDRLIFVVAKLRLRTEEADGSTQEEVPAQRKPALELQPLP